MQTEIEMAYIAGLMDGDGSFSLTKANVKNNIQYRPLIQLGSKYKSTIDVLMKIVGGNFTFTDEHINKHGKSKKAFYNWRLSGAERCMAFLNKTIPYLTNKKDRAELLLKYFLKNIYVPGKRLSAEVKAQREQTYSKMYELNRFNPLLMSRTKKPTIENNSDTFWSYLAGLFDTDGHFSITNRSNRYFRAEIQLHITDLRCINFIQENCIYGSLNVKKDKHCKHGMIYRYEIKKISDVLGFVEKILPFLKIKSKQAELLKYYITNKKDFMKRFNNEKIPEEELLFRRQCFEKMKQLHTDCDLYKPTLIEVEG